MAKANRAQNDIYAKLGPCDLLITNLPTLNTPEFASEDAVATFLTKNVHRDLQVKSVKFVESVRVPNLKARTAFVQVSVGSKRQAQLVKSALRNTWVHDKLLKVKTEEDAKKEVFDNRTVIITGIPKHLRADQVIHHFGKDAGAIVGLELPQENIRLKELRRKQSERQDAPESLRKEIDSR